MCVGAKKLARKPLDPKVKMTDKSMARNTSAEKMLPKKQFRNNCELLPE
jgi:hypothetical protein